VLSLLFSAAATAGTRPSAGAMQLQTQADVQFQAKAFEQAAKLYEQSALQGAKSPHPRVMAAAAYALAGKPDAAMADVQKLAETGYADPTILDEESPLHRLSTLPSFHAAHDKIVANRQRYLSQHADPDAARFITSDIDLFWSIYDKLAVDQAPAKLLQDAYLEQGSVGLQEFVPLRIRSGENLYDALRSYPRYYAAIRQTSGSVAREEPAIRAAMRRFKSLYPGAQFPDIYFVIGAMNTGGTSSDSGLLIAAEMNSREPGTPDEELKSWQRDGLKPLQGLPYLVLHELVHFQQTLNPPTLLAESLKEGVADFLGEMSSGGLINASQHSYGKANEAALWAQFEKDMAANSTKDWLYGGRKASGVPVDMGYFVGYRIAQAYYDKAKDKKQAIADMLDIHDAKAFLAASGYAERFK
jgi:hypothetical protein